MSDTAEHYRVPVNTLVRIPGTERPQGAEMSDSRDSEAEADVWRYDAIRRAVRAATIEECAQIVAERVKFCLSIGWELGAEELEIVAAAIRALKEQPNGS